MLLPLAFRRYIVGSEYERRTKVRAFDLLQYTMYKASPLWPVPSCQQPLPIRMQAGKSLAQCIDPFAGQRIAAQVQRFQELEVVQMFESPAGDPGVLEKEKTQRADFRDRRQTVVGDFAAAKS